MAAGGTSNQRATMEDASIALAQRLALAESLEESLAADDAMDALDRDDDLGTTSPSDNEYAKVLADCEWAERALARADEGNARLEKENTDLRREVADLTRNLGALDRALSDTQVALDLTTAQNGRLKQQLAAAATGSRVVAMAAVSDGLAVASDTGSTWRLGYTTRNREDVLAWLPLPPVPGTPAALTAGGTASEAAA